MALEWMPRENGKKDHLAHSDMHWGTEAPCVVYEKKPFIDQTGNVVAGLYSAWISLNNPTQYNSYTTEMVKGVIAGFRTPLSTEALWQSCLQELAPTPSAPGGNTKEYSEYYSRRPDEYGHIWNLFNRHG